MRRIGPADAPPRRHSSQRLERVRAEEIVHALTDLTDALDQFE